MSFPQIFARFIFTSAGVDPQDSLGNGAQNVLPNLVEYTFPAIIIGLYVAAVLSHGYFVPVLARLHSDRRDNVNDRWFCFYTTV